MRVRVNNVFFGITGACRRQELSKITTKDIENHGSMLLVKILNTKNKIPRSFTYTQFKIEKRKGTDFFKIIKKVNVQVNALEYINLLLCRKKLQSL